MRFERYLTADLVLSNGKLPAEALELSMWRQSLVTLPVRPIGACLSPGWASGTGPAAANRLPRLLGHSWAALLLLTGDTVRRNRSHRIAGQAFAEDADRAAKVLWPRRSHANGLRAFAV